MYAYLISFAVRAKSEKNTRTLDTLGTRINRSSRSSSRGILGTRFRGLETEVDPRICSEVKISGAHTDRIDRSRPIAEFVAALCA